MITHVKVHNIATYSEPVDIDLKLINFIYGGNGTGKTTLSKLLSGEISSTSSSVKYDSNDAEEVLVYNKSFVEQNFREVKNISGIFTLGKDASELQAIIEKKEKELEDIINNINIKKNTIEDISKKRTSLLTNLRDSCWPQQTEYSRFFPLALTGTRNSKANFAQKCLTHFSTFSDVTKSLDELKDIYHAAFSKEATIYKSYSNIDIQNIDKYENHPLLSKKITGKSDSDIGRFIEFLDSSDWVKQGMVLASKTDGKCPYCTQPLPSTIKKELEDFFDATYETECTTFLTYKDAYVNLHTSLISNLKDIILSKYDILDYTILADKIELYQTTIDKNITLLEQKANTPSLQINLNPCLNILTEIIHIIDAFNEKIKTNNKLVENQKESQLSCSNAVWDLIVLSLKDTILAYNKQENGYKTAIKSITSQITTLDNKKSNLENEIREKRSSISNIHATADSINNILQGYEFSGFTLIPNDDAPGTYKIVRPDGSDAKESLSEGEYNFITFLYFYHLVFGTTNSSQLTKNKIVIIDDPISSLDSNVLFIVSSLVKQIISFCKNSQHSVKQVIISTHNIYFHKEITFSGSRNNSSSSQVAYFVIRKKNNISKIDTYIDNPIQTSYDMLWEDIREPKNGTAKSIFNTMRRILENYFKIIGGIDYEECINSFEGEDRYICKSLLSCINEHSHIISDDLYMCIEDSEIDHYISIFKEIFVKMGHISHYEMMMTKQ